MVRRSKWHKSLTAMLAWAGMAIGQFPLAHAAEPLPTGAPQKTIKVVEMGKPAQKCKVLKSWITPDGCKAYEVQALDTGEVMTIVESGPISSHVMGGGKIRAIATSIFHWGRSKYRPQNAPMAPDCCDTGCGDTSCGASPCESGPSEKPRLTPEPADKAFRTLPVGPQGLNLNPTQPVWQGKAPVKTVEKSEGSFLVPTVKGKNAGKPPAQVEITTQILPKALIAPLPKALVQGEPEKLTPAPVAPKALDPVKPVAPEVVAVPVSPAPQVLEVPLHPPAPKTVTPTPAVAEAQPTVPTPIVVEKPDMPVIAAPPAKAVAVLPNPGDFRESWGKPVNPSPTLPVTPYLPQAKSVSMDPLVNPENYGKTLEGSKPAQVADNNDKKNPPTPAASAGKTTKTAAKEPEKPKKHWTLFGGMLSRSKGTQPATVEKSPQVPIQQATAPMRSGRDTPLGVESVYAANSGMQGPVRYVPVPVVTLPNTTRPPAARLPVPPAPRSPGAPQPNEPQGLWANAFTPANAGTQASAGPYGMRPYYNAMGSYGYNPYSGYGQPNPMMVPASPYSPVGAGGMNSGNMAAATRPGTIPGYPRYPNGQPYPNAQMYPNGQNAYPANPMAPQFVRHPLQQGLYPPSQGMANPSVVPVVYNQAVPTARPTGMANASSPSVTEQQTSQMLAMLKDSLYPSQREWAANNLAACEWKTQPTILDALTSAAAKDPAATVRAGCVRALAKMNAATVPVITAVQLLKTDVDPRVRVAAEETLAVLIPSK